MAEAVAATTAFDLWLYAKEFADAGKVVRRAAPSQVSMPAYLLFGQSIELSLKAFLRGRGIPIKTLRSRAYGHDLRALLIRARKRRLDLEVKLEQQEIGAISLLSYEYLRKRYQYSQKELGATMYVPLPDLTESAAQRLVNGLRSYCAKYASRT